MVLGQIKINFAWPSFTLYDEPYIIGEVGPGPLMRRRVYSYPAYISNYLGAN